MLLLRRQGILCASARLASQPLARRPTSRCYPTIRIQRAAHASLSDNIHPYLFPVNAAASAILGSYKSARSSGNQVPGARSPFNRVPFCMSSRRLKSSTSRNESPNGYVEDGLRNGNGVYHSDDHGSHSHSIFGPHSHGEGHDHGHEQIVQALQGSGDRGSQITLVGLFSNIGLTAAKGAAGWYMHSASLLADAGHSLSDLLGDFVTLFCWKLSRKPPSIRYPYGFAKFETLGTTTVSLLLIGGAIGIGFHSYHLLIETLGQTASTLDPGSLQTILNNVTATARHVPAIGHSHGHVDVLDPNAAWFAAISIIAKEWLYRITKKVADEERSPVLLANAIHHRSDAYSSIVALLAILGTWWFPALPLDPIGGLLVSVVILQQGFSLLAGAFGDLTDVGINPVTRQKLTRELQPLIASQYSVSTSSIPLAMTSSPLLGIRDLRGKRSGSLMFVDLTADVSGLLTVRETSDLESKITSTLKNARKEIAEVRVKFHPVDDDVESAR